jgi:hypothetical protein
MPGILGTVAARSSDSVTRASLSDLEAAMPLASDWMRHETRCESGAFQASCFARNGESATGIARRDSKTLVLDGEVFGLPGTPAEQPQRLLEALIADEQETLDRIQGRFVVAVWCEARQVLTLYTDKFGTLPFYYCQAGDTFGFSTSINALRGLLPEQTINRTGLVQFFTFGHLWNDDTFEQSIRAAWSAAKIRFETATGSVTCKRYWRPQQVSARARRAESLNRLTETLQASVRQQSGNTRQLGVALSGGLDARTMLAMADTDAVRPKCVSLGMAGSLDQRSASRLAELAGCEFHSLVLGEGFLEGFRGHLERMVELSDGHYLDQCIVMPTFPLYEDLGITALQRGHVGELLHMHKAYNFSVDDSFRTVRSEAQLETWLFERLQSHLTEGVQEQLFQEIEPCEFQQLGKESLRRAIKRTDHFDHPLDRLSQLFLDQRTRRETAVSLVKFSSVADPRVPYCNSDFIDAVFAADPELRVGETIQSHMLRKVRPEFMKPANSNTGAPVGVSALRRQLSYYRMRVFAKLGVPGYQPYERLGLWLKRDLSGVVKDILLADQCLERNIFNPDCVRQAVQRHLSGAANQTYLLMAMMIVEISQRMTAKSRSASVTSPASTN